MRKRIKGFLVTLCKSYQKDGEKWFENLKFVNYTESQAKRRAEDFCITEMNRGVHCQIVKINEL